METEWKIGEIRQVNGEWCQCVEGTYCKDCAYHNEEYDLCDTESQECLSHKRNDGKDVIFKKLEKVGEPYRFGKLLMQQYRIFTEAYIPKGFDPVCVLCRHGKVISIEIEQNKEDMKKERRTFKAKEREEQHSTENCPVQTEEIVDRIVNKAFKNVETQLEKNVRKLKARDFNLEEAKAGKPVCTRDGRKARIICFDAKCNKPIVALIYDCNKETVLQYLENGRFFVDQIDKYDLMMLPEKKEGWVNVYKSYNVGKKIPCMSSIYPTKEEAKKSSVVGFDYVDTVKIEWEE